MDKVFIHGLKVDAIIGVYDWEKQQTQPLIFDLDMAWDLRPAAATDDLSKTLNYQTITESIEAFVVASRYELLETLVEDLAAHLRQVFTIPWLAIKVQKPAVIPQAQAVGVYIERGELQ